MAGHSPHNTRSERCHPSGHQRGKSKISDLAVFGAPPAFEEPLFVSRPNLENRAGFLERLEDMFESRWFTNDGPLVGELERELAKRLGVRDCVVSCSGTMALQLAVRALGLKGEAIVPSFGFVSLPHSLSWLGVRPVFCDITPGTWNIDPDACESLITADTSAIIGVHVWGQSCETRSLARITARHGLRLLYDAAHAFGCAHDGSPIGSFGDAEVFSFHATKVFHTFEGGAVATNDEELGARLRLMRNFGFTGYDTVVALGTNAKMSEPSAAMGLANLDVFEAIVAHNSALYGVYREGLRGIAGLRLIHYDGDAVHNRQYVVLEVDQPEAGLTRDDVMRVLHAENVLARRYFFPGCHRMEPYATRFPEVDRRLPHTNRATGRVLVLPSGTSLEVAQVREICAILRLCISEAATLHADLSADAEPSSALGPPEG